jgi:hypothetical protein
MTCQLLYAACIPGYHHKVTLMPHQRKDAVYGKIAINSVNAGL